LGSSNRPFDSHKSIIAYLSAHNLPDSAAALRTELNLSEETFDAATAKKYETLLEKKWTSVVRLQKKACREAGSGMCFGGAILTRALDHGP
jgi:platelet-activating factor acetylhydrolase IB subunit alpha